MTAESCPSYPLKDRPAHPDHAKLLAYHAEIERLIARCMDELYLLALKQGCRTRRAALADIEYRARLVLKRDRQECAN